MAMTSRERVETTLQHREPDRVPLDLGGSSVTGMHVNTVYALRQALGLDPPGAPVKVVEPYQMLGEIQPDLLERLGVDVVPLSGLRNKFGFANAGWKPWTTFQGVPVLVPGLFNTEPEADGSLVQYPEGDPAAPPSGRMPRDGLYFDAIVRQPPIDDAALDPAENTEEFGAVSDADLAHFETQADWLYRHTDKAILANFGGTGFGDISYVPGVKLKYPRGIRDIEEWYMSLLTRRDYVYRVFEGQCAIGLENLKRIHQVVGERITAVLVTGTDFGAQHGLFIAREIYRDLFMPFHRAVNAWIHANTSWKSFIHSCGSVRTLIPDFIEAGFDILNPVQTSAAGMDPNELKQEFGRDLTFWGGGVDTQSTLPFGSAGDVRRQVQERMALFAPGGGFVFNPVHNVQAGIPIANLIALYETVQACAAYPRP